MWWWLGLALAGDQAVAELEWTRASPLALVTQLVGADVPKRLAIVRALGRVRDPRSAEPLAEFRTDPDPSVRLAAAQALGWVPGGIDGLRGWYEGLPTAGADQRLRAALLLSIGLQGSTRDLGTLLAAVQEPWPVGESAALALGHFGNRGLPAMGAAPPVLVTRLDAFDPRIVEAVAFALRRIAPQELNADERTAVLRAIRRARSPSSRAWLITAVWPSLRSDERDTLFIDAMMGSSRLVRVAALDAIQPGDMPGDVLQAWLVDPDPWVRAAALAALGRAGASDDLHGVADNLDRPWRAAAAVVALGEGEPALARDPEVPAVVRSAHAALLTDADVVLELLSDPQPMVRSGAALSVLAMDSPSNEVIAALWANKDPLVREVAAMTVAETGDVRALVQAIATEEHPDVVAAMLESVTTRIATEPRAFRGSEKGLQALVTKGMNVPALRPQAAARALAESLESELPEGPTPELAGTFELPGEAEGVRGDGWPQLDVVEKIVEAHVRTDLGDFVIQLEPEVAPLAVHAFAKLAEAGFYDGLVMHRMAPGFVVQGGDPRGDGWGGPGWGLADEVSAVPFGEGAVGMARGGPDTGGSQWFVTTSPQPHLVGAYTRFGTVVQGQTVASRLPAGAVIEGITILRDAP